jgi:hypothetical protein
MIDGSTLGRMQKIRAEMATSADGKTKIEWEVTEFHEGESEADSGIGRGKRKLGEVGEVHDVTMKS